MTTPEIELDHIGIAVEAIAQASFWQALGWSRDITKETVAEQKVTVGFLPLKNSANIELLEPTQGDSPIRKFMDKRGPGIHHICLRVKDINSVLKKLKAQNVKLINETPVKGAHNCLVAFVHPSSTGGVLVELSQKEKG